MGVPAQITRAITIAVNDVVYGRLVEKARAGNRTPNRFAQELFDAAWSARCAPTGEQLLECVMRTQDDRVLGRLVRAEMCKLPVQVFAGLHADDYTALEELIRPLLPAVIRADEDGGLADIRVDAAELAAAD